jgi:ribosome-associated protein
LSAAGQVAKLAVLAALFREPMGGSAAGLTEENILTGQVATSAAGTQTPKAILGVSADEIGSERLLNLILSSLNQDGAEEIVEIDLAGKSTVADYMVIASGRSTRHVAALSENLVERLKHEAGMVSRVEGKDAADWVLIDTGDVIVHIFRPEVREFYQLEKMWLTAADKTARRA